METVLIVIHLIIVLALVGVVLLQRSEGGALGIGIDVAQLHADLWLFQDGEQQPVGSCRAH